MYSVRVRRRKREVMMDGVKESERRVDGGRKGELIRESTKGGGEGERM